MKRERKGEREKGIERQEREIERGRENGREREGVCESWYLKIESEY
jgi:hypothetical protein